MSKIADVEALVVEDIVAKVRWLDECGSEEAKRELEVRLQALLTEEQGNDSRG